MFGKWFRKPKEATREQVRAEGAAMTAFVKPLWVSYAKKLPANDAKPLASRMIEFLGLVRGPLEKKFPEYRGAPDKIFRNVIFVAILEADTHSTDSIEKAMIDIEAKDIEVDLKATAMKITAALNDRWLYYQKALPFSAEVPLATRVEHFVPLASEYVTKNYPVMNTAPSGLIWEMVWVAIIESKSHPVAEVNAARAALGAKHRIA